MSDYLEKALLDHILGNTAYSAPATVYLALFTDSNTATQRDAGTVTEVSGNNYSRKAVTNNTTNWPNASGTLASKSLGVAQTFATPSGSWGTVTAYGVYDASTAGNLLFWADLDVPQAIVSGNTVQFGVSGISITLD
jgi:hypothetical protein